MLSLASAARSVSPAARRSANLASAGVKVTPQKFNGFVQDKACDGSRRHLPGGCFLVAPASSADLFICAKDLFDEAKAVTGSPGSLA